MKRRQFERGVLIDFAGSLVISALTALMIGYALWH